MLDRVILGDNQFFGINHMSEEKAQALSERFKDLQAIIDVVDTACDCGVRAMMLNTNERAMQICDHFRRHPERYRDLVFYASMPYAHKYANAVAEKGIFGAIKNVILEHNSAGDIAGLLAKGGATLFTKDMVKVMQMLVDVEMTIFKGLNVRVVFLQNIVTDLLLGFGVKQLFAEFAGYVRERYGVEPGFVTMNLPALVKLLKECGIANPVVCSSINKAGYFMNPDIPTYEKTIRENGFQPIAMSILASGAVSPREAVGYVCGDLGIRSVVFGASSRQHILETKAMIESYA